MAHARARAASNRGWVGIAGKLLASVLCERCKHRLLFLKCRVQTRVRAAPLRQASLEVRGRAWGCRRRGGGGKGYDLEMTRSPRIRVTSTPKAGTRVSCPGSARPGRVWARSPFHCDRGAVWVILTECDAVWVILTGSRPSCAWPNLNQHPLRPRQSSQHPRIRPGFWAKKEACNYRLVLVNLKKIVFSILFRIYFIKTKYWPWTRSRWPNASCRIKFNNQCACPSMPLFFIMPLDRHFARAGGESLFSTRPLTMAGQPTAASLQQSGTEHEELSDLRAVGWI